MIGVGLNIRPAIATLPDEHPGAVAPGWLQQLQADADAPGTLLRVVAPLVRDLQLFTDCGFAAFQSRFAERDVLRGRNVQLSDGSGGTACGVAENGALRVQTSAGIQLITSSEISVRPVGPPAATGGRIIC